MLLLVATPIGNLDDISARAVSALESADVLACEDTRRTRALLSHLNLHRPGIMLSYREGNEKKVGGKIMTFLGEGKTVVLCSDGGYPGISDPGYRLVRLALDEGHEVSVIPGASAVPVALLMSGLPTSSYTFKGYPPRKNGARKRFFEDAVNVPDTWIVYESPFRVGQTLRTAFEVLGNRMAAVCIELTKKFERVHRGYLGELAQEFEDQPIKGEVVIVIAGNNPKCAAPGDQDLR